MKTNQALAVAFVVLLALSGWTYYDSVTRAERFERGQKFLPNLNPDEIVEILINKGEESAHLKRQAEEFVVVDANGYPATNESVNRFIRDVLDMSLEKEVGEGSGLEEELEISPPGENTVDVVFKNANEQEMVHFLIGKSAEGAGGNFVRRTDGDDATIYLTSSSSYLRTKGDDFLKKEIVDVKDDQIASIAGPGFTINSEDGDFKLAELPSGMKESSKVNSAKYILSGLRFEKHFLANDPEVARLIFDTVVEVGLNDDSGYVVELAESKQGEESKHYLRIQGTHQAQQVSIAVDAGDEEVKQTADTLQRLDELTQFNQFHGSWVYEVTEGVADKFRLDPSELVEDA